MNCKCKSHSNEVNRREWDGISVVGMKIGSKKYRHVYSHAFTSIGSRQYWELKAILTTFVRS